MLSEFHNFISIRFKGLVLILVLVEHALGVMIMNRDGTPMPVLILVLVEHALGDTNSWTIEFVPVVLILVLVEHALGVLEPEVPEVEDGLNHCFSGTCSRRTM